MALPFSYIVRNCRCAQAHDRAHRRRDGARRLRVRHRADAGRGARADAGCNGPGRQRHRDPPRRADRSTKRRRPAPGGDRRKPSRHRHRAGRRAAHFEGAGRAHQPAEARLGEAVERRDSRRDAGGSGAAAAGEARRRPDVPAGHLRNHRGTIDRQRLPGRGRRRDAALRLARLDGRRRVRRGPHRFRLGDLGRRRADAAGVPPRSASRR